MLPYLFNVSWLSEVDFLVMPSYFIVFISLSINKNIYFIIFFCVKEISFSNQDYELYKVSECPLLLFAEYPMSKVGPHRIYIEWEIDGMS